MIYTIGYEKTTLSQVRASMEARSIDILVDVRTSPYSRRPDKQEFNKNRLERLLNDRLQDTYLWSGEILGGKHGPALAQGIDFLSSLALRDHYGVLLLCMEHDPRRCHRFYDIGVRLFKQYGIDALHFMGAEEFLTSELLKGDLL
jgi:ATP-dependent DNA helicase RecQ